LAVKVWLDLGNFLIRPALDIRRTIRPETDI